MEENTAVAGKRLAAENRELRARLETAEETLRAIRANEVDALVITNGAVEQVRTLDGADQVYRTFVEVMCQGAATVGADGLVLYCNRHFAELLGLPLDQAVGASIYDFVAAEDEAALRAMLWEGLATSCTTRQLSLRCRDGSPISTVLTATPLNIGTVSCLCLVVTDLTDREARVSAEAANSAKDRFLAALSHELRTPLTPVVMTVAAMEADPRLPPDLRKGLNMVRRNVELETRLIDDLLDVSRVISGKLRLHLEPVAVRGLVESVLEMLQSDVNRKALAVNCQWHARFDCVNGDSARLQQVIWNLLRNAIKFNKERGTIDVRLRNPDDQTLQLEVRDNGVGIEPTHLSRIFNAFDQGDNMSRAHEEGLGLGLTIAKAIVDMHGGTMRAHSDGVGAGAMFAVTLPLTSRQARASATPGQSPDGDAVDGKSWRVLLVEDHEETAAILAKLLGAYGHVVKTAHTVASALQLAGAEAFDLVISDIGLPDGTGHDLMRQIKASHGIPGVALTGYGMDEDLARSREVGFAEHVVKPVNILQLQSVISRVVRAATRPMPVPEQANG